MPHRCGFLPATAMSRSLAWRNRHASSGRTTSPFPCSRQAAPQLPTTSTDRRLASSPACWPRMPSSATTNTLPPATMAAWSSLFSRSPLSLQLAARMVSKIPSAARTVWRHRLLIKRRSAIGIRAGGCRRPDAPRQVRLCPSGPLHIRVLARAGGRNGRWPGTAPGSGRTGPGSRPSAPGLPTAAHFPHGQRLAWLPGPPHAPSPPRLGADPTSGSRGARWRWLYWWSVDAQIRRNTPWNTTPPCAPSTVTPP